MQARGWTLGYWITSGLLAAATLADAIGGLTRAAAGQESLTHLGYPLYLLPVLGAAKLCAVPAVLQWRYLRLREWAYAGLVFVCLGAFASRLAAGDTGLLRLLPLLFLAYTLLAYAIGRRWLAQRGAR